MLLIKKKQKLKLFKSLIKWHFNYYFLKKSFPLISVFYLTNICNYKCMMCNIWRNKQKNVIPLIKFKKIINDLSQMGCYYVGISGGEPLLLNDIYERLQYAKSKIPYVHMVTNGYLLDEKSAKQLGKIGIDDIALSIDGPKEIHDKIRGIDGAFDRTVNAIKLLKKYSPQTKIVVNTIISPYNIDKLYDVVKLVKRLGVNQKFQPLNIHPTFKNQDSISKNYPINNTDIQKIKEFIKFIQKQKFVINSKYFLKNIPNYFKKQLKYGVFNSQCNLPYYYCEFNEKCEVFPCLTAMNWENGFEINENFKKTFNSKNYKNKQNQLKKCKLCQNNMYICYLEPRITFPLSNFIKYILN